MGSFSYVQECKRWTEYFVFPSKKHDYYKLRWFKERFLFVVFRRHPKCIALFLFLKKRQRGCPFERHLYELTSFQTACACLYSEYLK